MTLPFALHALARELDAALGILLRSRLDLPGFVTHAASLLDPGATVSSVAAASGLGLVVCGLLASLRVRAGGERDAALQTVAGVFAPLYLRPLVTLLALVSLGFRPTHPYGFTLPVALTQDWSFAQDALAGAAILAAVVPRPRLPLPGPASLGFVFFLAYALMAPRFADEWDGHPGNEPKYLRMAVAIGHDATLDVEGVTGPMEGLPARPLLPALNAAMGTAFAETGPLFRAALPGGVGIGADAIRATRITRQTVRGKNGGVYHVLAPGPSLLLAPALRLDRALNRARGVAGRVAIARLLFAALAAALVASTFVLARAASGDPLVSAALAAAFGLLPPHLFYHFQFYPEMLGALALAVLSQRLLFRRDVSRASALATGLGLAILPWLHQKFLPLWGMLVVMAVLLAVNRMVRLGTLLALVLPQVASLALTALYNFSITGSARPDALFLAWGPAGVTTARIGQGLLGLLFDARYGLLPYVPLYLLAAGGLIARSEGARRLQLVLPAALCYYLTVAAADNWAGAICNLGRYIMPITPLLAAFAAVALARARSSRAAAGFALALAAWSAVIAAALWRDPHAANDSALLLGRATYADGNAYVPNLFIRAWSEGAPGLWLRILVWLGAVALAGRWLRATASGPRVLSARWVWAVAGFVLSTGLVLERWPQFQAGPRFDDALPAGRGATVFVLRGGAVGDGVVRAGNGRLELLLRSSEPLATLFVEVAGDGVLRAAGVSPALVKPAGVRLPVPLSATAPYVGRRGAREYLYRTRLTIAASSGQVLRFPPESR